jgi:hypothetical protein
MERVLQYKILIILTLILVNSEPLFSNQISEGVKNMSRIGPQPVDPIIVGLLSYEQNIKFPGFLFVVSAKNREFLWAKQIYRQKLVSEKEEDVQIVYFKSMKHHSDKEELEINNEHNQNFTISIKEKERSSDWPAKISLLKTENTQNKRSILIKLVIPNFSEKDLRLDGLSVAEDGKIMNQVFQVRMGDKELPYIGLMAKRMAPSKFVIVKPGETYETSIDLEKYYDLPKEGGTLSLYFSTFNHFSPDEFHIESNILEFRL